MTIVIILFNTWLIHDYLILFVFGFFFLYIQYINYAGKVIRRIVGEELRRRNIRPAYCYQCKYNLAGLDVTHCPKCKTQLLSESPDNN